jgi:AcrR family transcriptional regulator
MATKAERRAPLTRDRILDAALRLADEGGIESLSMRKLGQALGVEAMSLYHHVANKDDVVKGILQRVAEEIEPPSLTEEWDAAIRKSAISAHGALRRHPWACNLMMSPGYVLATRIRYMDALLGRLRAAGFSPELTYHAYHVLDAHIFGFSLWQAGHSLDLVDRKDLQDLARRFIRQFPSDEYPHANDHVQQHFAEGPHQDVKAFEFALDLILDGLKRLLLASHPQGAA